jgi:outer membrane lipoprotein-sorting protein
MVEADNRRLADLSGYTGTRRYRFENKRFNKRAEMTVRMACNSSGSKTFEVVSEDGSSVVRNRILRKMLEAETEASQSGEKQQTRMIPQNYSFRLTGTESVNGRENYVLEVTPRTKNKFLIRGRIWVDAEDFAISRVEGTPAQNPSFWIRSVEVTQRYQRVGRFWLPAANDSRAEARIFGTTEVSIEYFDYVTSDRKEQARVDSGQESSQ